MYLQCISRNLQKKKHYGLYGTVKSVSEKKKKNVAFMRVFPLSTVSWRSERAGMVSRDGDSSVSGGISVEGPEFEFPHHLEENFKVVYKLPRLLCELSLR